MNNTEPDAWGSEDNHLAASIFYGMEKLRREYGLNKMYKMLNIRIDYSKTNKRVNPEFMLKRLESELESDNTDLTRKSYKIIKKQGFKSLDEVFMLGHFYYQLDYLANTMVNQIFLDLKVESDLKDNTGIYCWLLWSTGLFLTKEPKDVFSDA